jgi:two-component system chemotaxis sensor kinase CheA
MSFNPEELQEILSIYKAESEEHLLKMNECLIRLEKETDRTDILEEIFREAHSLKGSARMIGFEVVEKVAHRLEDLFGVARKGELSLGPETFDVIFEAIDVISRVTGKWLLDPQGEVEDVSPVLEGMESLLRGEQEPGEKKAEVKKTPAGKRPEAGTGKPRPQREESPPEKSPGEQTGAAPSGRKAGKKVQTEAVKLEVEETIRVTTQKLDDLMNRIGEILVTKIKFDQRLAEVRRLESDLGEIHREWTNAQKQAGPQNVSPSSEAGERLLQEARETGLRIAALQEGFADFVTSFNEDSLRMTLISGELQESINQVRMLPLSSLFNLFPRLLRDIVRGEGKEVELSIEGGGIQLDKKILEELKDPLSHLLRNAVDHGIEPPGERIAAGKEGPGRLGLSALQKASSVVIEVEDDGAGIDVEKVRSIALRRGFVSEEQLGEMTEQQIMSLVFQPGFSTKGIITDLSGRGVGLDVVFNNIERMKGTITLTSEEGKGSKFSIKLPVSLATSQALMVKVSEQVFAMPLTAVNVIMEVGLSDVMSVESREAILVDGAPISLVRLDEILGIPSEHIDLEGGGKAPVVVIGSTDDNVALLVKEVVGEKEIVVKGLGTQLRRVRNFSGATIMGDGGVVLILNVFDLIKSSQKARGMWFAEKKQEALKQRKPEILVADDSVTTRVLEKNILEGSGYRVTLAVDGRDALEKVMSRKFDLVVSDIEMPRMDGFELTRQIRKEKKFSDLPIILVTSLDSEEDKQLGVEAGADAYITKGAFEQGSLLSTIKQLL